MGKIFLLVAVFLLGQSNFVSADNEPLLHGVMDTEAWQLIGPGDADQVTSLTRLNNTGEIVLGTDIGGLYRTSTQGKLWVPSNTGLLNYDVTTALVQHPAELNTVFVGTRGGLYKSEDNGHSWQNIRGGLPQKQGSTLSGSIGAIAINPINNNEIVVGLGYRLSSNGTSTVKRMEWPTHIYRSIDAGKTWQSVEVFETPSKVHELSFDRKNRLLVSSSSGLYRSNASGRQWSRIYERQTYGVIPDVGEASVIVVATGTAGVFQSSDDGKSWQARNKGLTFWPHRSGPNRYSILAMDNDKKRLFVINSTWGKSGGLYSSVDGKDWKLLTKNMPESWLKTSSRYNAVAFDAEGSIYLGSSRYVYSSNDEGESWQQLISNQKADGWSHTGLNIFGHTRDVVVDPGAPNRYIIATADHGMVVSQNGGVSWNATGKDLKYGATVTDLEFCGVEAPVLLAASVTSAHGGRTCVSKSANAGATWEPLCGRLDQTKMINQIRTNPNNCNEIYLATDGGARVSKDSGENWGELGSFKLFGRVFQMHIAVAPEQKIFVASQKGLFKSVDEGLSWEKVDLQGIRGRVTSILVSKNNSQLVFAGTELSKYGPAKLLRSLDGGESWTVVLDDLRKHVSGIVEIPGRDNMLIAATNDHNYHDESSGSGTYRSIDYGKSWHPFNSGLPVNRAWNVSVSPVKPGTAFLSANGSGAYVYSEPAAH